jgi:hypothetical protein
MTPGNALPGERIEGEGSSSLQGDAHARPAEQQQQKRERGSEELLAKEKRSSH